MDSKYEHFERPTKKHRWGILANPIANSIDLSPRPTPTRADQANVSRKEITQWDDIDHVQTLHLGDSGGTSIVFHSITCDYVVLRSCPETRYTSEKKALVELSRTQSNKHLLLTACVFSHKRRLYVGNELSDISLEDLIDCTIPFEEKHVKTILGQVVPHNASRCTSDSPIGCPSSLVPSCMQ